MENPVTAHKDGTVTGLAVEAGAAVTQAPCSPRSRTEDPPSGHLPHALSRCARSKWPLDRLTIMEPVEINNGTWYLRGLRYDDRVDDRPELADLGETDLDYVHDAADGWADDSMYTWAVCEPSTGELLARSR